VLALSAAAVFVAKPGSLITKCLDLYPAGEAVKT
jgi:hypothetical protein